MAEINDNATIIGETIVIKGSLRGEEDLTVLGRVEGELQLTQTLMIADSGIVKAEISVRDAVVSGIVVGNITAADCIHITETGRVLGDISAKRVVLNGGGRVRGDINVGEPSRALSPRDAGEANALPFADHQEQPASLMVRRVAAGGTAALPARPSLGPVSMSSTSQAAMAMAQKKKKVVVKRRS
ncbi:MAG: polymer-forming cytoskeletal protein [Deltaproteobacteria bacterium]|nr:MAG: polymer-forming cytoskeletal protein [Deltaproteobacteria bacterium]